jgi:hypothetical protein
MPTIAGYGDGISNNGRDFKLAVFSDGRLKVRLNGVDKVQTPVGLISADEWYHAAATYDGTTIRLYVNGQEKGSEKVLLNTAALTSTIGRLDREGSYFDGIIDDVRIYNRALSDEQVKALYQSGAVTEGLVGWWKLDEPEGTAAADSSGSGNKGTLIH